MDYGLFTLTGKPAMGKERFPVRKKCPSDALERFREPEMKPGVSFELYWGTNSRYRCSLYHCFPDSKPFPTLLDPSAGHGKVFCQKRSRTSCDHFTMVVFPVLLVSRRVWMDSVLVCVRVCVYLRALVCMCACVYACICSCAPCLAGLYVVCWCCFGAVGRCGWDSDGVDGQRMLLLLCSSTLHVLKCLAMLTIQKH